MNVIERLAIRYLRWRGMVVLPRAFVGFAIGWGTAVRIASDEEMDTYRIEVPCCGVRVILNHALVIDKAG